VGGGQGGWPGGVAKGAGSWTRLYVPPRARWQTNTPLEHPGYTHAGRHAGSHADWERLSPRLRQVGQNGLMVHAGMRAVGSEQSF